MSGYFFWLGASADAETGSRASTAPVARRGPTGVDPARGECRHVWAIYYIADSMKCVTKCALCGMVQ